MGVDAVRVRSLSRLLPWGRRAWRIQRKIHDQSTRAARRLLRHAPGAHPRLLPQLLPARGTLAIQRRAARLGCAMTTRNPRPAPVAHRPEAADWLLVEEVLAGLRSTPKR